MDRREMYIADAPEGVAIIMTDPDIADRIASVFEAAAFLPSMLDEGWIEIANQIRESARSAFCQCGLTPRSRSCPRCGREEYREEYEGTYWGGGRP